MGLHDVAGRINTSVRRGSRLVNGLLQFSRKQIKEEFEIIDLANVINELCQIIRKSFDQRIDIQTDLPGKLPIMGDATSLSQALINLCNNARDAMPDGGRLIIKAVKEGKQVMLTVADNGGGMSPEFIHESLFRPFESTKKKGLGIGMYQTKMIVEAHRGKINVQSQPDKGTTIRVSLPAKTD